ncbi:MAG: hypothetical protein HBSAPP02_07690 [Phycisphaerae bacterium]|nr:MAG: CDP-diacylglycerol--glycerol-3-phosphate 3-phosphatidyltransferase [Planctomycetia bacterium]GJQ25737.1 MAG: hypothetical protein HBSAPP02_07690 [Phycisphaerae bacterium]
MNLPNQITLARLVLAIVFFCLLGVFEWPRRVDQAWMIESAFWLFIIAALSDILDGYLARKQNQVTSFGRILDPFVDKILVCGGFILLLGPGFHDETGASVTGLAPWMVVVIIARELLVTSLRGFSEAGGTPYAANLWGKVKMLLQSITIPLILKSIHAWRDIEWVMTTRSIMIWITVGVTILSVGSYLVASRQALSQRARG